MRVGFSFGFVLQVFFVAKSSRYVLWGMDQIQDACQMLINFALLSVAESLEGLPERLTTHASLVLKWFQCDK